jgi:hypothetical protein
MANEEYKRLCRDNLSAGLRIYWTEMLFRCHIAALASMCRHRRWISGILKAVEDENLFTYAASCRGYLESVADAAYSVLPIPGALSEFYVEIEQALSEKADKAAIHYELEKLLLHFSDATKKSAMSDKEVYEARQISVYLASLPKEQKSLVDACYARLCDITHPGMMSVRAFFSYPSADEWVFDNSRDKEFIAHLSGEDSPLFADLLPVGFNPSLIALRVINCFGLPALTVEAVNRLSFDGIKAWRDISRKLPIDSRSSGSKINQ